MAVNEVKTKIPEDWQQEKLGQYVDVQGGFAFKSSDYQDDGVPLIRIGNVGKGKIIPKDFIYLSEKVYKNSQNFQLFEDDVLMGMTGDLGKICLVKKEDLPALLNQRVGRFNKKGNANLKLVFYIVSYERIQDNLSCYFSGGAQANISPTQIESIKVLFPQNPKEQQKISEVLTTIDEAIEKIDVIIEKNKRIRKGLMQELFRYGIDDRGNIRSEKTHKFKTVKTGNEEMRIPKEWDVAPIGQISNYIKGYAFKTAQFVDFGVRVIKTSDLTDSKISKEGDTFISQKSSQFYSKWCLKKENIIITTVGSRPPLYSSMVGRAILVNDENLGFLLNQNNVLLIAKEKEVVPLHLYYNLMGERYVRYIEKIFRGNANQANITVKEFLNYKIPLPSITEQQRIVEKLSISSEYIQQEENIKQKLLSLKHGLMEDLLTGNVRVNNLMN